MLHNKRSVFAAIAVTAAIALVAFALSAGPARAQSPAVDFTGCDRYPGQGDWCMGWSFNVLEEIEITHLGLFDYGGAFSPSRLSPAGHAVGIWNASGALLGSKVVYPTDTLYGDNVFRFGLLDTPVTLTPGAGYVVAAVYPSPYVYAYQSAGSGTPAGWNVDSRVQYVGDRWASGTSLVYPSSSAPQVAGYGWFGGNFLIRDPQLDPVPEPALLQLPFLVGLGGASYWWRRRKAC